MKAMPDQYSAAFQKKLTGFLFADTKVSTGHFNSFYLLAVKTLPAWSAVPKDLFLNICFFLYELRT